MTQPPRRRQTPEPAWDSAGTAERVYTRVFRKANRPSATAQDRAALASAYRLVQQEREEAGRAVDEALAGEQQLAGAARWRLRRRQVRAALDRQYGDLGPQYEYLADCLARAVVRAEQADEGEVDGKTRALLDGEVRACVAALERYTESTKESVMRQRIQQAVCRTLEIAEQILAPQVPELWAQLAAELQTRLPKYKEDPAPPARRGTRRRVAGDPIAER